LCFLHGIFYVYFSKNLLPEHHVKMRPVINKERKMITEMVVQMMGTTAQRNETKLSQPGHNQTCQTFIYIFGSAATCVEGLQQLMLDQ